MSNRRELIGDLVALGIASTCSGLAVARKTIRNEFDVVVVGAGLAGLTVASELASNGIGRIVVLESEPIIGGAAILSNGLWKTDRLDNRLRGFIAKPSRFRKSSAESMSRIEIKHLLWELRERILLSGGAIRTGVRATKLLLASNRIVGIDAQERATQVFYDAKRAVVLATGGFAANSKLLSVFNPVLGKIPCVAPQGSRGSGLFMAKKVGGSLIGMDSISADHPFVASVGSSLERTLLQQRGALMVDDSGQAIERPCLNQRSFLVFDRNLYEFAERNGLPDARLLNLRQGQDRSHVLEFNSISELSAAMGIDRLAFEKTVKSLTSTVKHTTSTPKPKPLLRAPFYCMPVTCAMTKTTGGLAANARGRVLNQTGREITGLWAVGELVAGIASMSAGESLPRVWNSGLVVAQDILETGAADD